MPITIIINVNIINNPVMIGLSTLPPCTGLNYNIVSGGTSTIFTDDFNVIATSSQVIIEITDVSSNCIMPYYIYGKLYEQGAECTDFNVYITDECIIPPIPDISYDCVSGLTINNYNGSYTYNIEPNTQLNQGSYILTSVDGTNGCYSAINFNVPDCCPGYTVSASYECIDNDTNELTVIILDASGNVADLNITNITLIQNAPGSSGCNLTGNGINGSFPNSPNGYTVTNLCSGYYGVDVSISLDIGCIVQTSVTIQCQCIDCTDNPFEGYCCSDRYVWTSGPMSDEWCQDHTNQVFGCGDTDPSIPGCGGDYSKQIESWTVDTTNPYFQGKYSVQMWPSAVADKFRIYQDDILIAESPAVGFWNNTFCETDDVLGFWTNGINDAGSKTTPWEYDKDTNPGVSGMDYWYPIETNCGFGNDDPGCAGKELGMRERRGAGELFFEIEDVGTTSIMTIEVWFNPNCTRCTQVCTPDSCPFCDGRNLNGTWREYYQYGRYIVFCSPYDCTGSSYYCSNLLNSNQLNTLPYFNIDGTKEYDTDGDYNGFTWDCSQNGTQTCIPPWTNGDDPENDGGKYHPMCDDSVVDVGIPVLGKLTTRSALQFKVRRYNDVTCNPDQCELEYKTFDTSCTPGAPQFAWEYSYAVPETSNAYMIIDTPIGVSLVGKTIKDSNGNIYPITVSGSNYAIELNEIFEGVSFYAFYDSFSNQSLVPYGTYIFTTYLGTNLSCYDELEIETICECSTINGFTVTGLCLGEQNSSVLSITLGDCTWDNITIDEANIPSGMVYSITPEPFKVQFYGTPLITGTYNIDVVVECLDCYVSGTETLTVFNSDCSYSSNIINPSCRLANGSITVTLITCTGSNITWDDGATGTTRTNLSADTYIMYIEDDNGCEVSGTFTLTNVGAPTFVANDILVDCTATGSTIELTAIAGGVPPYTIQIDNITVTSGLVAGSYTTTGEYASGVHNIQLTDANGCTSSDYVVLTQKFNPNIYVIPTNITCNNPNGSMQVQFSPNYNNFEIYYSTATLNCNNFLVSGDVAYDTDLESNLGVWVTGVVLDRVDFPITVSGTYSVCFYDTSGECCTCVTRTVSGTTAPSDPSISNVTVCSGSTVTILGLGECVSSSVIAYYTAPSANSIITNGQVISGITHYTGSNNLTIGSTGNYLPTGVHTYYSACSYGSCLSGFDSFTVTVTAAPVIDVTGFTGCAGTYTVSATPGFSSYNWKINNVAQATTGSTLTNNYLTSTPTDNNSYTIAVTGTTANGCISTDTTVATVYPIPTIAVAGITICSPGIVNLFTQPTMYVNSGWDNYTYVTATANGYVFEYSLNNGATWSSVSPSVNVTTTTDYLIRVTSPDGCISTPATLHIQINGSPIISITNSTSCTGAVLTASNGFTYLWNTGATSQSISVIANGVYSVTGTQGGCTAAISVTVTLPVTPTISIDGITTCQNEPNILGSLNIVGNYDYVTVSSNNIAIVPNITIIGATTVAYNTDTLGTATITATAYYNNSTCTASTIATITINNAVIEFQDICYGQTLADAYVSSTVLTGNIIVMAQSSNGNCVTAGTYDGYNCCSNALSLGGSIFNPNTVLAANSYVAFTVSSGCCKTALFYVKGADIDITHDCHIGNNVPINTTIQIINIGQPSLQGSTQYNLTFTETTTNIATTWTQTTTATGLTYVINTTNLDRGIYDYEIEICYDYLNDVSPQCCIITGTTEITCCDQQGNVNNPWTCMQNANQYVVITGPIGTNYLGLVGSTADTAYSNGTYYIYETTALSTGDVYVSGNFVSYPTGTIPLSGLGLVSGDCYDIVLENSNIRSWANFCYNGTGATNYRTMAYNSWFVRYLSTGSDCTLSVIAREVVCFDIPEFGVSGGTCFLGGAYTYNFPNVIVPENYEFDIEFFICAEVSGCTAAISDNNVINSTNPSVMRVRLIC